MDVEHPSSPSFHEPGRQHPHEARQAQELDAALGQDGVERLLEGFPGGVGLVVDDERLDAGEPRLVEPAGIGPVRHDEVDVSREIRRAARSALPCWTHDEMRMATRRRSCEAHARPASPSPDALAAFVADDFADVDRLLAHLAELRDEGIGPLGGREGDHADAAIEGPQHFGFRNATGLRQPAEDRRNDDRVEIEPDAHPVGQHPGDVVRKAPAGDMAEGPDVLAPERMQAVS